MSYHWAWNTPGTIPSRFRVLQPNHQFIAARRLTRGWS